MAKRSLQPKAWYPCPCCGFAIAVRFTSCTQCGHGQGSFKLIRDAVALEETRDLGIEQMSKVLDKGVDR